MNRRTLVHRLGEIAEIFDFELGSHLQRSDGLVDLSLSTAHGTEGTVVLALDLGHGARADLEGVAVEVLEGDGDKVLAAARTDGRGRAELPGLEPGRRYRLRFPQEPASPAEIDEASRLVERLERVPPAFLPLHFESEVALPVNRLAARRAGSRVEVSGDAGPFRWTLIRTLDAWRLVVDLDTELPYARCLTSYDAFRTGGVLVRLEIGRGEDERPSRAFLIGLDPEETGRGDRVLRGERSLPLDALAGHGRDVRIPIALEVVLSPVPLARDEISEAGGVPPAERGATLDAALAAAGPRRASAPPAPPRHREPLLLAAFDLGEDPGPARIRFPSQPAAAHTRESAAPVRRFERNGFTVDIVRVEDCGEETRFRVAVETGASRPDLDPGPARDVPGAAGFVRLAVSPLEGGRPIALVLPLRADRGPARATAYLLASAALAGAEALVAVESLQLASLPELPPPERTRLEGEVNASKDALGSEDALGREMLCRLGAILGPA